MVIVILLTISNTKETFPKDFLSILRIVSYALYNSLGVKYLKKFI